MANTITIDIEANLVDKTSTKLQRLEEKLFKIEKRMKKLDSITVSAVITAADYASGTIDAVMAKAGQISGKIYRFGIGVFDYATPGLSKIETALKKLTGGSFNITLGATGTINLVQGAAGAVSSEAAGLSVKSVYDTINNGFSVVGNVLSWKDTLTKVIGKERVGKIIGSAAGGNGLLGFGSNATIALGGGNYSATASMGAAGMSGLGLGAVAGGVIGGATIISGIGDIVKSGNYEGKERDYHAWKGGTKIGAVGAGAAAGAAIGSVVPVVGTAIGALLGAGIGGLAGMFGSDSVAKWATGYDEEDMRRIAELESHMVGYSEASKNIIRNSKLTASELNAVKKTKIDEWFGDVALSMRDVAEVNRQVFKNVFGADTVAMMDEYANSVSQSRMSLENMNSALLKTGSTKYKLEEGESLSDKDSLEYAAYATGAASSYQDYLEGQRYEVNLAADILLGENSDLGSQLDSLWSGSETKASEKVDAVNKAVEKALGKDGKSPYKIDDTEKEEIDGYLQELQEMQAKIDQAEQDANFETLKRKYGNPKAISAEAREDLFAQFDDMEKQGIEGLYELESRILASINQMEELDEKTRDDLITQLYDSTDKKIADVKEKYASEKATYFEDGLQKALADVKKIDSDIVGAMYEGFNFEKFKESVGENEHHMVPETLYNLFTYGVDSDGLGKFIGEMAVQAETAKEQLLLMKQQLEDQDLDVPEWITKGLHEIENLDFANVDLTKLDPTELFGRLAEIYKDSGDTEFANTLKDMVANLDFSDVMNGTWEGLLYDGNVLAEDLGHSIANTDLSGAEGELANKQAELATAADEIFSTPITVQQLVNVEVITTYSELGGNDSDDGGPWKVPGKKATGGFVNSKQLSWVGEEGPEAIIPLVSGRRGRAVSLWEETGKRLGMLDRTGADDGFGKVSISEYAASSAPGGGHAGSSDVTIAPGAVQIAVKASEGQTVTQVIEENLENIGERVAGVIANRLAPQFENTPVRA